MKKLSVKVSFIALACVLAASFYVTPFASALDLVSPYETVTETQETSQYFTVKDKIMDFGRASEKGRSYTKALTVQNNTNNDVIIDVSARKYEGAEEKNTLMTDWVAFVGGVTHFNIAKGASRDISVRILVPETVDAGTQYTLIDLVDTNGHKETVSVKLDIAGDGLKYGSDVVDGWIDPIHLDNKVNGRVTVKNLGTGGFISTYQIKAKSVLGGDWEVIYQENKDVLPGKSVTFTLNKELGYGIYQIEQRVTYANNEGKMAEILLSRTAFNIPWWVLAAFGGLIVLIIIIVIIVKHHKKDRDDDDDDKKARRAEKRKHEKDIVRVEKAEEAAIEKELESDPEEAFSESEPEEEEEQPVEEAVVERPVHRQIAVDRPVTQARKAQPARREAPKKIDIM